MRVLVTCVPQTGHLAPLVSFAEVLAAQGDQVIVASGADVAAAVESRGLPFRQAGPPFEQWFGALAGRTRGMPGDGLAPERVERYFIPRLFGEIGTALMLDDLLALGRELAPDLIVYDPYLFAAPLAARALAVHPVLHMIGPLMEPSVVELTADAISPIWRELGLDVPADAGLYGGTTLTVCPPSLDPAGAELSGAQPLRPAPLAADVPPPAELPDGLWQRPVVYLTLGTFSNTNLAVFRMLIDGMCALPVNVVVTTGRDIDPAELGTLPAQVQARHFIPQAQLLPHCTAVVHHAGAGTMFGVLAHGLPSVAVPQSADNFGNAGRLRASGAAEVLMPHEVTVEAVSEALRAVLTGDGHRTAAATLAAEIAGMPAPEDVASVLREKATPSGG